jgi:2-polyprenyl-3-methyl-5-hydroxy-6-metoxy-1,4-benzoquinol methylase
MNTISITGDVPLQEIRFCPACTFTLKPISALRNQQRSIRIGLCHQCGYFGYMDRPTKEWLNSYYSTHWDKEFIRSKEEMKKDIELPTGARKGGRRAAFKAAVDLKSDKERPVCEIGSGYGQIMKNFENAGFKDIIGVENSLHRTQLVREVFGFPVVQGTFGTALVEEELKKFAPFALMFCYHVLEHVFDPEAVIASMSRLQSEGDFAIFALPNSAGEHVNYSSLYLPHLHSFSKNSLEILFNRFGYELFSDKSSATMNTILIFKKTTNPKRHLPNISVSEDSLLGRFGKGLGLHNYHLDGLYALSWTQEADGGDGVSVRLLSRNFFIGKLKWYFWQVISYIKSRLLHRITADHIILVQPLQRDNVYPQEIWFDNDIRMLIK